MRKILITLVLTVALSILWYWRGRDFTLMIDRFGTVKAASLPIKTVSYEGDGTGGILHIDELALSLEESTLGKAQPSIGTTKDGQLALSFSGKVFAFGPLRDQESLTANVLADDLTSITTSHSLLSWPNFFEVNFMTGNSPKWKRFSYQRLIWKKSSSARLEMIWRCEQFLYPQNDWSPACMTDPGFTGLIRVEISDANR